MTDRITAEAGHTPGPWHIFASGLAASRNQVEINDPEGLSVAYVLKFVPEYVQQSNANARLIAAAPELLEALKEIEAALYVDENTGEWRLRESWDHPKMFAALSRAQGTAS